MTDIEEAVSEENEYIVVGVGGNWDVAKGLMMQKTISGKARKEQNQMPSYYYSVSIPVDESFSFQIVHSEHHWKERWYPPGNGGTVLRVSRAESNKGVESVGNGKDWKVDLTSGPEVVCIYFSPMKNCVMWTTQTNHDSDNFQMPNAPRVNIDQIWAATQLKIEPANDPLSKTLLTAVSTEAAIVIACLHCFPYAIMILLLIWVQKMAATHLDVGIYKEGMGIEWVNATIIYFCIFSPKTYEIWNSFTVVREVLGVSRKISNNPRLVRGMRIAAGVEFFNLIQPIFALLLSVYVSLFLSENIFLNVVLNVLALEFVATVDEGMIAVYIKERFGEGSVISFVIIDLHYATGIHEENDFWNESQLAKSTVLETLKSGDISNNMRWKLVTSISKGLGLLGVLPSNRDKRRRDAIEDINSECVIRVEAEMTILDWSKVSEADIQEYGGLYLSATTEFTWESIISKKQKGRLLKYYPNLALNLPWKGCLKFSELGLDSSHAPALVEIINSNPQVVEIDMRDNKDFGPEGVKIMAEGLKQNATLRKLSFHACDINDVSAQYIGELFKENRALEYVWLLDNKNLGDEGAKNIMKAFVDEKGKNGMPGYNNTLQYVYMNGSGVSKACQEICTAKTRGKMSFGN